jgi:hypothetical protein
MLYNRDLAEQKERERLIALKSQSVDGSETNR